MKAFYIIHITVILEIILAIFITIKLSEFTLKIRNLGAEIEKSSELKLDKIIKLRERLESFNTKCAERFSSNFDFIKKLFVDILLQGVMKKYLPKNNFLSQIWNYKTTIVSFLLTLFFLRKKNA